MSFGPDVGGFVGDLSWFALKGVTNAPGSDYATTIPQTVFMIYQCMFAVITPALITGAFAERVRFAPFAVFSLLWAVLVYNPVCHCSGLAGLVLMAVVPWQQTLLQPPPLLLLILPVWLEWPCGP